MGPWIIRAHLVRKHTLIIRSFISHDDSLNLTSALHPRHKHHHQDVRVIKTHTCRFQTIHIQNLDEKRYTDKDRDSYCKTFHRLWVVHAETTSIHIIPQICIHKTCSVTFCGACPNINPALHTVTIRQH